MNLSPGPNTYVGLEHVTDNLYQVVGVHRIPSIKVGDMVHRTHRGWVVTRLGHVGPVTVLPNRTEQVDSNWKYLTNQREEE